MNTIKTWVLGLAVGLLSVSCGSSTDDKVATGTVTGGRGALAGAGGGTTVASGGTGAPGGASAGGGTTSSGGAAITGGAPPTAGAATGGTGGTVSSDETCAAVCDLFAGRTTPLTCVPSPCLGTCTTKYNAVVVADAVCGGAYLALLNCGVSQPADAWQCYSPVAGVSIPVPPSATATDPCYAEFQTLYLAVLGSSACLTAFMS
jgi:hypothetical protein